MRSEREREREREREHISDDHSPDAPPYHKTHTQSMIFFGCSNWITVNAAGNANCKMTGI